MFAGELMDEKKIYKINSKVEISSSRIYNVELKVIKNGILRENSVEMG